MTVEWTQIIIPMVTVLGMFIANATLIIPLFIWVRSEARADARHTEDKLESTRELVRAIYNESKEFHKRLCEIESKKVGSKGVK